MTHFCAFPGCDNPPSPKAAKGLCSSHYWQLHKGRELTPLSYRRNRCVPWIEAHVDHDGDECLMWPFQRLQDGGMAAVKYKGKQTIASRVMCTLAHGEPPTLKHEAAHSCGNGHLGCMNPTHLRWATPKENSADKFIHGTVIRGEKHAGAKLKADDIPQIRALAGRITLAELGRRFGVTYTTVRSVIRGETWRHV